MGFSAKKKPLHCRALLPPAAASANYASLKHLHVWSLRTSKASTPATAGKQSTICSEQNLSRLDRNNKTLIRRAKLVTRGSAFWSQKTDKLGGYWSFPHICHLLALCISHVETEVGEGYPRSAHKAYFVSHSLMRPSSSQPFFLSLSINTHTQDPCLVKPFERGKTRLCELCQRVKLQKRCYLPHFIIRDLN